MASREPEMIVPSSRLPTVRTSCSWPARDAASWYGGLSEISIADMEVDERRASAAARLSVGVLSKQWQVPTVAAQNAVCPRSRQLMSYRQACARAGAAAAKGSSSSGDMQELKRRLLEICTRFNIRARFTHTPGVKLERPDQT